ncbi:MAG: M48 family metallopeptidase [Gammaproteobacteria bacterium]|nr:M48 family metallopeptidase [Gammaproteobacteria bacterium]MDH5776842.1 M48 family metallopeptidase [Gammaproteobacteria bacterium]
MNFFAAQDRARRKTGWLVLLFMLAVIGLISLTVILLLGVLVYSQTGTINFSITALQQQFNWSMVTGVAAGIVLFIFLGSIYKYLSLSQGGAAVAEMLGGRLVSRSSADPDERRLLNVVDEMAIASGITVPRVYVLDEMGINAFAAGLTPNSAVIGVTNGTLTRLNREELQGVIAHEFSHIFNGDMRLNLRLIGVLHGILLIGLLGFQLLRSLRFMGRSRNSKGGQAVAVVMIIGLGLTVIGYVGYFFGQWIKAMVSRQREYLADASAVRYTRNRDGIAGALKKIGGFSAGSFLDTPTAAEYSHAYFAQGVGSMLDSMFATHPPLDHRIKSIEPDWDGKFIVPEVQQTKVDAEISGDKQDTKSEQLMHAILAGSIATGVLNVDEVIEQIGAINDEQVHIAQSIIDSIPVNLRRATEEPYGARAVIYGLLLDRAKLDTQKSIMQQRADAAVLVLLNNLLADLNKLPELARLPLLEMTIPTLKGLSKPQYQKFREVVQALISADKKVELHEWVIQRLLIQQLDQEFGLRQPAKPKHAILGAVKHEAEIVLSLIAIIEHSDEQDAQQAFAAGKKMIGAGALNFVARDELNLAMLNSALDKLEQLKPLLKPRIIKAMAACIMHDGKATIKGQELLRAIASCLDCPIPPVLTELS